MVKMLWQLLLLLLLLSLAASLQSSLLTPKVPAGEHDLICRQCGHRITSDTSVISKDEQGLPPVTIDYAYEMTVVGANTTVHVFTNPAGERFHVLNTRHASVRLTTEASEDATWYPGHSWVITTCAHCGTHMGWYFQPVEGEGHQQGKPFHGVVMDKVVSAEYCDSLVRVPGGKH